MTEKISIIVPVYKVERSLLCAALDSIRAQSYTDWECILVDDGTPDDGGAVCDDCAAQDARFRVIHTENQGVSAARNTGLAAATGAYVTFVDSDDWVTPQYLEHMYAALTATGADCAVGGCKFTDAPGQVQAAAHCETKPADRETLLTDLFYMRRPFAPIEVTAVWGTLYRADCLREVRFRRDMAVGEDFAFKMEAFRKMARGVYLDSCDYGYLVRGGSAMRKPFDDRRAETFYSLQTLMQDCAAEPDWFTAGLRARCVNLAIVLLLTIPPQAGQYAAVQKEMQAFIRTHRRAVLRDPAARPKVKLALLASCLGFGFMAKLFALAGQ